MAALSGPENPPESLEAIQSAVAAANAELYRHLALYLQVLRAVLQHHVDQACFHLVTRDHGARYLRLGDDQRLALHRRLTHLVERCTSLLTVEQLAALAAQMQRQRRQRLQRQQRELLRRHLRGEDILGSDDGDGAPEDPVVEGGPPAGDLLPPGSVRLQMTPPLGEAGLQWSFQPWLAQDSAPEDSEADVPTAVDETAVDEAAVDDTAFDETQVGDAAAVDQAASEASPSSGAAERDDPVHQPLMGDLPEDSDLDALSAQLLRSLGLADLDLSALLRPIPPSDGEERPARPQGLAASADPSPQAGLESAALRGLAAAEPRSEGEASDLGAPGEDEEEGELELLDPPLHPPAGDWQRQGLLPKDPVQLLQWLDGTERALGRRLRHLSHAINKELLRSRVSNSLLPSNLLEAVIRGQVETQSSPANLVRLQLPFGLQPGAPPLQTQALLLRVADLEMEEARLRTCRRRLQQHRQELRRMAQQYRRLQRRLQAREAERLWSQDIRRSRSQPD